MKASELRIGNLGFYSPGGCEKPFIANVYRIDLFTALVEYEASGKTITAKANPEYDFVGIPITEEWLLKFGFNRQTSEHYYIFHNDKVLFTIYNGSLVIEGGYMPVKLQYVHQLQNLFFILSGEELKLKP